jgi:hypothetical protein
MIYREDIITIQIALERIDSQEIRDRVKWELFKKLKTLNNTNNLVKYNIFNYEERSAICLALYWLKMHYYNELHYVGMLQRSDVHLMETYLEKISLTGVLINQIENAGQYLSQNFQKTA